MTFGLKNAGATYQRAMNYIFHDLIGKLVEIYIASVVVPVYDGLEKVAFYLSRRMLDAETRRRQTHAVGPCF
jgi:hypothetical protein